ncbi:alpha-1,2-Mannosidase [Caenorhabditis elegans]|nr:alpha-1,2-Mannosidase [Caenorhabditis elegans]CBK19517.1 alpha-1,2-Mannosidase [Caenorhabditis elegans]|eukprot:NP_001255362.1 alpha-1,2-Mannosidase [Caenorhabditis elegans]
MQLLVFLALYLNLAGPAELLNPRRQKFFGTNSANRQNSNETYGTPKATKLKRAPPVFQGPTNERQKAIVRAFQHAWSGYKKYAWGHDELRPVSKRFDDSFGLGLTIIDSLDTAIIMGLEEETRDGVEWIRENLNVSPARSVNVFETTIRVLGGLLSGYHLTGEEALLEKATQLGDNLIKAFTKSSSLIPKSDVNLDNGNACSPNRDLSSLAEATTLQLEFRDLTALTGDQKYEDVAFGASEHVHNVGCKKMDGLCPFYIDGKGEFKKSSITLGARADSYYEYLIKQWLQTKKSIDWLRDDFIQSIAAMKKHLYRQSQPNSIWFLGEITELAQFYPKMDHLVCFLSGSLVLSHLNGLDHDNEHLEMAKNIGNVCHKMYENPTGLGPEIIHFNMEDSSDMTQADTYVKNLDAHSLLRPEAIEAWFYLYRVTKDKKYQEWGWKAFESIEKYAKVETGGYSSIDNVLRKKIKRRDKMESFFLAETLKYLYLLMADDQEILPLDRWVLNTEAHPLPIYN